MLVAACKKTSNWISLEIVFICNVDKLNRVAGLQNMRELMPVILIFDNSKVSINPVEKNSHIYRFCIRFRLEEMLATSVSSHLISVRETFTKIQKIKD